jgi:hypothetical protein
MRKVTAGDQEVIHDHALAQRMAGQVLARSSRTTSTVLHFKCKCKRAAQSRCTGDFTSPPMSLQIVVNSQAQAPCH